MTKSWLPLEANPEVLSIYAKSLGLPESLAFHDVLGVESWALEMIPSPIHAFLLLFPISEASELERKSTISSPSGDVYFMKQNIGNACGTIAVLHTLINLHMNQVIHLVHESYISRRHEQTASMTSTERAIWLENDKEIETAHLSTESLGQSAAPSDTGAEVDTHFIAFIPSKDGTKIFELDGRREGPVVRASLEDPGEFGARVLDIIKTEFMDRNPQDIRFSILALCSSSD